MTVYTLSTNGGTSNQTQINSAISGASSGDTVHLNAGTFKTSGQINTKTGVNLEGAGVASTIILVNDYTASGFLCESGGANNTYYTKNIIAISSVSNMTLSGMTVDGGATITQSYTICAAGSPNHNYYREAATGTLVANATNVTIHDMKYQNLVGDAIRNRSNFSNIDTYNIVIDCSNHDGIEIYSAGTNWHIHNCYINVNINCGVRIAGGAHTVLVERCEILSQNSRNSGGSAIQFQGTCDNPIVDKCIIHNIENSVDIGITTYSATGTATATNNIFWGNGSGNIVTTGLTLTSSGNNPGNTGNASPTTILHWTDLGYGYVAGATPPPPTSSDFITFWVTAYTVNI